MTSNSDFFDASELFNIPEQFDIPEAFYRVDEFSKKFNVRLEDIISTWLGNKISLYVNLRSEYCRIIRYANKKEHRYDTFDIRAGGDFYQHETSPQSKVRKFIPCGQSEIKEDCNFSGSSFYKYIYNGYASGFGDYTLRALPTLQQIISILKMLVNLGGKFLERLEFLVGMTRII
ncbi:hypothetical protein ACU63U_10340 [Klebsiella aerogenes]